MNNKPDSKVEVKKSLLARKRAETPWVLTFQYINRRCSEKNHDAYKRYGAKGIKNLLTVAELEYLWKRDKANLLKKPSIDRINSKGNYCLENCRYIELSLNTSLARRKLIINGKTMCCACKKILPLKKFKKFKDKGCGYTRCIECEFKRYRKYYVEVLKPMRELLRQKRITEGEVSGG